MSRPASREVVSITSRSRWHPDFRGLASGQVRAAREKMHLDHAGFAEYLSGVLERPVRPDVLSRWEDGTGTPPGDVVLAAAAAAQAGLTLDRDQGECITHYPSRGLITRQQWNAIIAGSRDQLWLYGMAELPYAEDEETPGIMAGAAAAGCDIRIMLLNPAWPGTPAIDEAEGKPEGALVYRIRAALAAFGRMRATCEGRMQIRLYDCQPTTSIVRGDGEMLATSYMRFTNGSNSPTLGLTSSTAPRTFRGYSQHFTAMWELAREAA